MKANLMKISVLATVLIFLLAGASWADNRKSRNYNKVENKHSRNEYDGRNGYRRPSHFNQGRYEHPRCHDKKRDDRHLAADRDRKYAVKYRHKYHQPVHKQDYYRYNRRHNHYHKHKSSYNVFSFRAPAFEPGWTVIIKTKNRW